MAGCPVDFAVLDTPNMFAVADTVFASQTELSSGILYCKQFKKHVL